MRGRRLINHHFDKRHVYLFSFIYWLIYRLSNWLHEALVQVLSNSSRSDNSLEQWCSILHRSRFTINHIWKLYVQVCCTSVKLSLFCSWMNVALRSLVLRCHKAMRKTNFSLLQILVCLHTSHFRSTSLTSTCRLKRTIGSISTTRRRRSGQTGTSTIQDHQGLL